MGVVLDLSTPKDMRENIEMLAHCQLQTNETLAKITDALQGLSKWMILQEKLTQENQRKIELIMKATKFTP